MSPFMVKKKKKKVKQLVLSGKYPINAKEGKKKKERKHSWKLQFLSGYMKLFTTTAVVNK